MIRKYTNLELVCTLGGEDILRSIDVLFGTEEELNSLKFSPPEGARNIFSVNDYTYLWMWRDSDSEAALVAPVGTRIEGSYSDLKSLSEEDKEYIRDRIMIKCGSMSRVLGPVTAYHYKPQEEAVLARVPEIEGCPNFGTVAVQLRPDGDSLWTISYVCENHQQAYRNRIEGERTSSNGKINVDRVFPSKVHVVQDFHAINLEIIKQGILRPHPALFHGGEKFY